MSVGHDLTTTDEPIGWARASGLDLLGEVQDSGLAQPTYLVRRTDGQVVQLSELLHLVLAELDPVRSPAAVASAVSDAFGRRLTAEGLAHLLETRLQPLGLVAQQPPPELSTDDETDSQIHPQRDPGHGHRDRAGRLPAVTVPRTDGPAPAPTARPLLSLSLRGTLLPARWVRAVARMLAPLYYPPIVLGAIVCAVIVDLGLLRTGDLLAALTQVLAAPALLLALYVTLSLGGLIHELGHAAACSYGGGRPGTIGVGVYLLFPAFYTDVTDSYRLRRSARIRTDLGGLYFNVWCIIGLGALYRFTGDGVFMLALVLMHVEMLQQLVPVVRLDGYYVLADVAGVPDLFARVGPVLRGLRPGAAPDPRVSELRPRARRIVIAWVLFVVPTLLLAMGWLLWSLPLIIRQTVSALRSQFEALDAASTKGDTPLVLLGVLSLVLLAVPLLGLAVLALRVVQLLAWRLLRVVRRPALRRPRKQHRQGESHRQGQPQGRHAPQPKTHRKTQVHTATGITMPTTDMHGRSAQADRDAFVLHDIWGSPPTEDDPGSLHQPSSDPVGPSQNPDGQGSASTDAPVAPDDRPGSAPPTEPTPGTTAGPAGYEDLERPTAPTATATRERASRTLDPLTADAFSDAWMLPSRSPVPRKGWRRAVFRASGGSVNPGPGASERRQAELAERLRQPIEGSRRVVVMSRKGGVGKTTTTLALGSTFSQLRGDRVVAVDANPDAGNLAHRVSVPNDRTITDVLHDLERIDTYAKLRGYTSQAQDSRLEVLASDDDPRIGMALDRTDYHRLIGLLDRFYNLILLDTGTGILDSANQGLLAEADQLVLVLRPGVDGGRAAALTLDWLDEHDYGPLVSRAVVVVNGVRSGVGAPLEPMVAHFEQRCARVVTVPWDPALETGSETHLSHLAAATRHSLVEMAAAVADGFRETGVRR
ncbi:MAG: nucleotide-binding protein [Intrasporangium sp.]|uniref:nucleotide-binding protein n=1 Tax=Intrasporangium sp. TaxID=1925024 RepID=UPI003F804D93